MVTIGTNLQALKRRMANAALACGRNPADIGLMAVSKTFGAADVATAYAHGQIAFGENYVQEAVEKIAALSALASAPRVTSAKHEHGAAPGDARGPSAGVASPTLTPDLSPRGREEAHGLLLPLGEGVGMREGPLLGPLEWHFIGPIQSNKTGIIAGKFAWVHSIDRLKIAERLSAARPAELPPLQVCIQVNLGAETTKSGIVPGEALALARAVAALPHLNLRGLMAIPPASDDRALQRGYFAQLRRLKEELVAAGIPLDTLSMGMSDDLESAITEGATLVRVGTAIFGVRRKN